MRFDIVFQSAVLSEDEHVQRAKATRTLAPCSIRYGKMMVSVGLVSSEMMHTWANDLPSK